MVIAKKNGASVTILARQDGTLSVSTKGRMNVEPRASNQIHIKDDWED